MTAASSSRSPARAFVEAARGALASAWRPLLRRRALGLRRCLVAADANGRHVPDPTSLRHGSVRHAVALPAGTCSFADAGPLKVLHCGGYLTYTPGQGAGGRYTVLATATGTRPGRQRYRLQAALAGPDDMAPGVRIENLETRGGSLSGIDVVDLYRFQVPRARATSRSRLPDASRPI